MSVGRRRWPLPTAASVALCLLLGLAATSAVPHTAYAMEVNPEYGAADERGGRTPPRVLIEDLDDDEEDFGEPFDEGFAGEEDDGSSHAALPEHPNYPLMELPHAGSAFHPGARPMTMDGPRLPVVPTAPAPDRKMVCFEFHGVISKMGKRGMNPDEFDEDPDAYVYDHTRDANYFRHMVHALLRKGHKLCIASHGDPRYKGQGKVAGCDAIQRYLDRLFGAERDFLVAPHDIECWWGVPQAADADRYPKVRMQDADARFKNLHLLAQQAEHGFLRNEDVVLFDASQPSVEKANEAEYHGVHVAPGASWAEVLRADNVAALLGLDESDLPMLNPEYHLNDLQGVDPLPPSWPREYGGPVSDQYAMDRQVEQDEESARSDILQHQGLRDFQKAVDQDYCSVPLPSPRPRRFFRRRPAPVRWSCRSACLPQGDSGTTCHVGEHMEVVACERCPVQVPQGAVTCAKPRLSRYQRQCMDQGECSYRNGVAAPKCHWQKKKRFWHAPLFSSVGYSRCGVCQGKYVDLNGKVQDTVQPKPTPQPKPKPKPKPTPRQFGRSMLPTF